MDLTVEQRQHLYRSQCAFHGSRNNIRKEYMITTTFRSLRCRLHSFMPLNDEGQVQQHTDTGEEPIHSQRLLASTLARATAAHCSARIARMLDTN